MSRRNPDARCRACLMYQRLCLCALVPRIETRTRLVLVIHRYEARKPTNTGQLAARCLVNSETHVRGHESAPSQTLGVGWDAATQPLLLFPAEGAIPLTEFAACSRPLALIVPDGTWRQASRVASRVPGLSEVPCVTLPAGAPTRYRLRAESHHGGLSTIEAIARAMGILEGPAVQEALERVFAVMIDRTLELRGAPGSLADSRPPRKVYRKNDVAIGAEAIRSSRWRKPAPGSESP